MDWIQMTVRTTTEGAEAVSAVSGGTSGLLIKKGEQAAISLEAELAERVSAPVKRGDVLGEIRVKRGDEILQVLPAVAGEDVALPGMIDSLIRIRDRFMLRR